ncbi:uncharacterized protein LAESUDRAFT_754116 [Laetiporus sulphureus 93-53]|uniref:Regulator of G protein signaling superfamily n=1 Tax=Laetiporus sulphureus 93-53 TaxID=1314785 RepID=A0A165II23_9APHY|nr:uncharacterized protein LAESUDRAFT_754116 [Laetiporus sulphureus 93-53]KZT13105.1 hypothetical protein LAESUDRAFT_754116 [Laetiporus sulphureus 93-53]
MPSDVSSAATASSSSHMMKTTKRGRPFLKDTLDLFATLIVSLELSSNKQFFRTFHNSFTTDDAAKNLASLKFSQSNRGPDPREPSRIVTTTTTTTFSMTREMAKAMCQQFMDARLIENAADPGSNLFKDRGVYVLTPKGLHVLERFMSKNGISGDHLANAFATQPICMKLLHLERRSVDDEIIVSHSVITALFRRFVGRHPNYPPENLDSMDAFQKYHERSKGVALMDITERPIGSKTSMTHKCCFMAVTALEWLCDFTSVIGREEAAEMAAQFVRFGLIQLVSDKRKNNDSAIIFTVRGASGGQNSSIAQVGEFRCTAKAIYRVTEEGRQLARWDMPDGARGSPNPSSSNMAGTRSSDDHTSETQAGDPSAPGADVKLHRRISMTEKLNASHDADQKQKESNSDRLKYIIEEPQLRSLFRDFLRSNFCEENLSFYLDVQDLRRKFHITSSAMASTAAARPSQKATPGQVAMERHHETLIQTAFVIYNTYLAPSSPNELNIDHGLRNELSVWLNEVITGLSGKAFQGRVDIDHANAFNATQLQAMIKLYERIQMHVFRLMATDSVPKFIKTPKFLALRIKLDDEDDGPNGDSPVMASSGSTPSMPPGLNDEEIGGAYVTISARAAAQERAQTSGERSS